MGYYLSFMFLAFFAILENSILTDFRLLDGQPSLVLIAVVTWAWHADLSESLFWAFVGGIALDILNPIVPTGTSVIAMVVVVFGVKVIERAFYNVSIFALVGFVLFGTVLHHVILYGMFVIQGVFITPISYVQDFTTPTLLFNLIGTLPMYWFLRRFQKRLPQRQSAWDITPR